MERNRIPNPKFVEWMRHRIKLAGEEIIKRADLIDLAGFDAMTQFNIEVRIPTRAEMGDIWPSLTFSAICGDVTMADDLTTGLLNPYPPEQFIWLDGEIEDEIKKNDEEDS